MAFVKDPYIWQSPRGFHMLAHGHWDRSGYHAYMTPQTTDAFVHFQLSTLDAPPVRAFAPSIIDSQSAFMPRDVFFFQLQLHSCHMGTESSFGYLGAFEGLSQRHTCHRPASTRPLNRVPPLQKTPWDHLHLAYHPAQHRYRRQQHSQPAATPSLQQLSHCQPDGYLRL